MIDMFTLLLVHGLLFLALYRLMTDDSVDREEQADSEQDGATPNGGADAGLGA